MPPGIPGQAVSPSETGAHVRVLKASYATAHRDSKLTTTGERITFQQVNTSSEPLSATSRCREVPNHCRLKRQGLSKSHIIQSLAIGGYIDIVAQELSNLTRPLRQLCPETGQWFSLYGVAHVVRCNHGELFMLNGLTTTTHQSLWHSTAQSLMEYITILAIR